MKKNTVINLITRILILFFLVGIVFEVNKLFLSIERTELIFPYDSFYHVRVDIRQSYSPIGESSMFDISAAGSGTAIGYLPDGSMAVLTADHVCNPRPFMYMSLNEYDKEITLVNFYGEERTAKVILYDYEKDLCILSVEDTNITPVGISWNFVSYGEKVYNTAAPMSLFSAGMVPLLDGYYSGDMENDSVYSIPAAPGSSGSGIFNSKGLLVGVIHSSVRGFSSIAISPTHEELIGFLLEFQTDHGGIIH